MTKKLTLLIIALLSSSLLHADIDYSKVPYLKKFVGNYEKVIDGKLVCSGHVRCRAWDCWMEISTPETEPKGLRAPVTKATNKTVEVHEELNQTKYISFLIRKEFKTTKDAKIELKRNDKYKLSVRKKVKTKLTSDLFWSTEENFNLNCDEMEQVDNVNEDSL